MRVLFFGSFQWSKGRDFQICPPHLPFSNLCDTTHVYSDAPCIDDFPGLGEKWSHQQAEMCGTYSLHPYMEHLELQYQPAIFLRVFQAARKKPEDVFALGLLGVSLFAGKEMSSWSVTRQTTRYMSDLCQQIPQRYWTLRNISGKPSNK